MDATDLIEKDHRRVEELFKRFNGGGGVTGLVRRVAGTVSARERRTALDGICRELEIHTRIEEELLYPAARKTGDREVERLVDESLREHAKVKTEVASLRRDHDGEDLDARVANLQQDVEHHVSEEEGDLLPRLRELIPDREREALGRTMAQRKRAVTPKGMAKERRPAARSTRRAAASSGGGRAHAKKRRHA